MIHAVVQRTQRTCGRLLMWMLAVERDESFQARAGWPCWPLPRLPPDVILPASLTALFQKSFRCHPMWEVIANFKDPTVGSWPCVHHGGGVLFNWQRWGVVGCQGNRCGSVAHKPHLPGHWPDTYTYVDARAHTHTHLLVLGGWAGWAHCLLKQQEDWLSTYLPPDCHSATI